MECPNCGELYGFYLEESSDDYKDGDVICEHCHKAIGTFKLDDKYKEESN